MPYKITWEAGMVTRERTWRLVRTRMRQRDKRYWMSDSRGTVLRSDTPIRLILFPVSVYVGTWAFTSRIARIEPVLEGE